MSRPSEAMQRSASSALRSVLELTCEAHAPHGDEIRLTEFALNVLVNAMAKIILADAAAECAHRSDGADENAVLVLATMKAAKLFAVLPQAFVEFVAANAAAEAANANQIRLENAAVRSGRLQ